MSEGLKLNNLSAALVPGLKSAVSAAIEAEKAEHKTRAIKRAEAENRQKEEQLRETLRLFARRIGYEWCPSSVTIVHGRPYRDPLHLSERDRYGRLVWLRTDGSRR